jgi:hypothetical protein
MWYVAVPLAMVVASVTFAALSKLIPPKPYKYLVLTVFCLVFPYAVLSGRVLWFGLG